MRLEYDYLNFSLVFSPLFIRKKNTLKIIFPYKIDLNKDLQSFSTMICVTYALKIKTQSKGKNTNVSRTIKTPGLTG